MAAPKCTCVRAVNQSGSINSSNTGSTTKRKNDLQTSSQTSELIETTAPAPLYLHKSIPLTVFHVRLSWKHEVCFLSLLRVQYWSVLFYLRTSTQQSSGQPVLICHRIPVPILNCSAFPISLRLTRTLFSSKIQTPWASSIFYPSQTLQKFRKWFIRWHKISGCLLEP